MRARLTTGAIMAGVALVAAAVRADLVVLPENGASTLALREGKPYITLSVRAWGPAWGWVGLGGDTVAADGGDSVQTAEGAVSATKARLTWRARVHKTGADALSYSATASADRDTDLTLITLLVQLEPEAFKGGKADLRFRDGETQSFAYPWGRSLAGGAKAALPVERMTLTDGQGRRTVVRFPDGARVVSDGDIRVVVTDSRLAAATPATLKLDLQFPEAVTFHPDRASLPQEPGFEAWYPFTPTGDHLKPSCIGMADWLEKPAGKHGRVAMQGDRLTYDGKPLKLWGLNVCYASCAPPKDLAEKQAAFYAKYGVNAVRLHKFADAPGWAGVVSSASFAAFDAAALDRLDYFVAQLKTNGIYVELSANFGVKVGPADRALVPFADEFPAGPGAGWRNPGGGTQFFSRELADLHIAQMVAFLKHRNPYTGLTYAEDPAVCCIEMANEDNAFWFSNGGKLKASPTLRAKAAERFTAWLEKKYGTKAALLAAWGGEASLNSFTAEGFTSESWERRSIVPAGNPWFFDPEQLEGSQRFRRQRLLDTMEFLYDLQNEFYTRHAEAVRAAGYGGLMLASNWQAGRGAGHYYNLHSDSRFGLIDRHNYFGGGSATLIDAASMLAVPGSGMLSSGLQQVAGRPFMLSEWIHCTPNEWGVEGPALIGAYGMGLQGWDVSFMFQNRDEGVIASEFKETWQVSKPTQIGLFPAVARQVLRGDVSESPLVIPRFVHVPSLREGKLGFRDRTTSRATPSRSTAKRSRAGPWPWGAVSSISPSPTARRPPLT